MKTGRHLQALRKREDMTDNRQTLIFSPDVVKVVNAMLADHDEAKAKQAAISEQQARQEAEQMRRLLQRYGAEYVLQRYKLKLPPDSLDNSSHPTTKRMANIAQTSSQGYKLQSSIEANVVLEDASNTASVNLAQARANLRPVTLESVKPQPAAISRLEARPQPMTPLLNKAQRLKQLYQELINGQKLRCLSLAEESAIQEHIRCLKQA